MLRGARMPAERQQRSQPRTSGAPARFADRRDAGRKLAGRLERFRDQRPIVAGITRGGMPVAAEVATALGAPLDVAVVCKIGAPHNRELAVGAVAEDGTHVVSDETAHTLGISQAGMQALIADAERELAQRLRRYRDGRPPAALTGRTVILVDDGLATGRSADAAARSLRRRGAARVILAVPVAASQSLDALRAHADEIVCVELPEDLWAVGLWYEDFRPTADDEVAALLVLG